MLISDFDLDREVLVIAEIGNNHEGDFALAEELIAEAAEAGAGAVKFQTCVPERFVARSDQVRIERMRRWSFTPDQWARLAEAARRNHVLFLSTPLDLVSADLLAPLVAAFKIASSDNSFDPLLEKVATFGKPVIISSGLADLALLRHARGVVEPIWAAAGTAPGLVILHCVTSYPVPPEQANLAAIATLRAAFPDLVIGYSDHTLGIEASVLAAAMGVRIIEKHFTRDKNQSEFRDHALSADPADLRLLCQRLAEMRVLLGDGVKAAQSCEKELEVAVRRSIAAGRHLPAGHVLTWDDLMWVRPGSGLPPGQERLVLGRRLTVDLALGDLVRPEHLD